ncbi:MAG TPA: CAP domain-containing protein [Candidatus Acidoferrum sp.]|nr:CAP domain-containing protein [Candidatus Acidoferrum sp.]
MNRKLIIAVFFISVFLAAPSALRGQSRDELKLFNLMNQEREKAGLLKFQWSADLAKSARAHAQLLTEHRELSHRFTGEPVLSDRIGATGLRYDAAAENVASAAEVEDAHAALMKSPGHRANILNPKYNAAGLAVVPHGARVYVAQNFAHVLPVYSETQFRRDVVAAVNKLRQSKGIGAILARADAALRDAACAENPNLQRLIRTLPGVTHLVAFTSSVPDKLPESLDKAVSDATMGRMNIGVCFRPGPEHGFASFSILAAFYSAN